MTQKNKFAVVLGLLLAVYIVMATVPTDPITISPNGTTFDTDSITLTCSGSTDPESGTLNITFLEIDALVKDPVFYNGSCSQDWCNSNVSTFPDPAGGNVVMAVDVSPRATWLAVGGGASAKAVCERGEEENYYLTGAATWITNNNTCNNLNGSNPEGWHLAVIEDSDENALVADLCDDVNYCYVGGYAPQDTVQAWQWIYNRTQNVALQNNTNTSFDWSSLSEGEHLWGCQIVDNQSEATGIYQSNFSISLSYLDISFLDEFEEYEWENMSSGTEISAEFISNSYATNVSTTEGNVTVELPSGDYLIRYLQKDSYERVYSVYVPPFETTNLNLYMLNKSDSDILNVTVTVKSTLNEELENARVKAQRYDITTNTYKTTESIATNFEGEGVMAVVENEFYRFIIEYPFGTTVLSLSPSYIYADDLSFFVDIGADPTDTFYFLESIATTLSYSNATSTFSYTFNDPSSEIEEACLRVYTRDPRGDTMINESCLAVQSGTINLGIAPVNGTTYLAKSYVTYGSVQHLLETLYSIAGVVTIFGTFGIFIIALVTIAFALVGIWNPVVALVLAPLPLLMGSILGLIAISTPVAGAIVVIFFILAFAIGRKA